MTENPAPIYFNARRAFVSGTAAMLGAAWLGIRSSAACRNRRGRGASALSHLASKGPSAILNWFSNPLTLLKPTSAKR
jgi:hypothetical protein